MTLIASFFPALRATRVPPIAAVREGAELPPGRFARFRTPFAALLSRFRACQNSCSLPFTGSTTITWRSPRPSRCSLSSV